MSAAMRGPAANTRSTPALFQRLSEAGVVGAFVRAEFQHVAERRDAAPARSPGLRAASVDKRRRHRGGVGVVGIVHKQKRSEWRFDALATPRPSTARKCSQRVRCGRVEIGADNIGSGERGDGVERPVRAFNADAIADRRGRGFRLRRWSRPRPSRT